VDLGRRATGLDAVPRPQGRRARRPRTRATTSGSTPRSRADHDARGRRPQPNRRATPSRQDRSDASPDALRSAAIRKAWLRERFCRGFCVRSGVDCVESVPPFRACEVPVGPSRPLGMGGRRAVIAALYVETGGVYYGLQGVDPWDKERDARLYAGPHPVVAHPPCSRWCRLAGLVESRWGHKRGDDGGCFEAALRAVRTWRGVLEHPAYSDAWPAFGLMRPSVDGWQRGIDGGWVAHVEQGRYGHPAKKATWLYAHGIGTPPQLRWGRIAARDSMALVSWCRNRTAKFEQRPRVGKAQASRTPLPFRDALLEIARSVREVERG